MHVPLDIFWSGYLNSYCVVTRYENEDNWWFLPISGGVKAQAKPWKVKWGVGPMARDLLERCYLRKQLQIPLNEGLDGDGTCLGVDGGGEPAEDCKTCRLFTEYEA